MPSCGNNSNSGGNSVLAKRDGLDAAIEAAIRSLAQPPTAEAKANYIASFTSSAQEKAKTVLKLLSKPDDNPFLNCRPVLLSVGGGDGTELEYLLNHTDAQVGFLLEGHRAFAEAAREKAQTLPDGKRLVVLEGDAKEGIQEAADRARDEVRAGAGAFLAVTCHAVLHELADRGRATFDPAAFFGSIFSDRGMPTWFTYREPGVPSKWPEQVLLEAHCQPESLKKLAMAIRERHPVLARLNPEPAVLGDSLRLHSTLAMEVLCKLFYLQDLGHEIEERSTSVDHHVLQNFLWHAIGETARREQRASITTESAPTESFVRLWEEFGVLLRGMSAVGGGSAMPLSVAESQTRVVAYRRASDQVTRSPEERPDTCAPPPTPIAFRADSSAPAIHVAADAFQQGDDELLLALLSTYGRAWIETTEVHDVVNLCEAIVATRECRSALYLLAHYLHSICALFMDRNASPEMFSEEYEVDAGRVGLDVLFRAERMEFSRRLGNPDAATSIARTLLPRLDSLPSPPRGVLRDYVMGTSHYLVANLFRHGGLYQMAQEHVTAAQRFLWPGIPSHDTEAAHCYYASGMAALMTGSASFRPARDDEDQYAQRLAGGFLHLSYSFVAWSVDEVDKAVERALDAYRLFQEAGQRTYVCLEGA